MLAAHLGDSLAGDAAGRRRTTAGGRSSSSQATGLGTTFVPTIIGFGAVLDNLSDLLDNVPLATTIAGAVGAWIVVWSFLSGGIIDRLARDRATRSRRASSARRARTSPRSRGWGVVALDRLCGAVPLAAPAAARRLLRAADARTRPSSGARSLIRLLLYLAFGLVAGRRQPHHRLRAYTHRGRRSSQRARRNRRRASGS